MGSLSREKWSGKRLLEKLELISFLFFYTLIIIVPFFYFGQGSRENAVKALQWIIIGVVFYVAIFLAVQQYILRKIGDKWNGMPVMGGWIDEEEDLGEPYEFRIKSMTPFALLSEADKKATEEFIKQDLLKLKQFEEKGEIPNILQLDYNEGID